MDKITQYKKIVRCLLPALKWMALQLHKPLLSAKT